jgi:hypothetical protein
MRSGRFDAIARDFFTVLKNGLSTNLAGLMDWSAFFKPLRHREKRRTRR